MSCCPNLTIAENAAKMSGKIAIKINFGGDMLISSGDPKRPAAHVITSSLMAPRGLLPTARSFLWGAGMSA